MAALAIRDGCLRKPSNLNVSDCSFSGRWKSEKQSRLWNFESSRSCSQRRSTWLGFGSVFLISKRNPSHCPQLSSPGPSSTGRTLPVFCVVTEKIVGGTQLSASVEPSLRRLILLRHAKSSWSDRSIKDHGRPLSKRGRQAAANIALQLQKHPGWIPQLILCSDSIRTRETLEIMQQQVPELSDAEVRFLSSFYSVAAMDGHTHQHLQEIICEYSEDHITTITCMGHNRGWEEAATLLSGVHVELKTANAALLEAHGKSWQEAFESAGLGGWKLLGIVKPDSSDLEGVVQ